LGDRIEPGDQVVLNDPYAGGTHLNDVTLVAPCFVDGELAGWAANRAHHADLGGMAPGSMPPEAVDIQQEGLRIPPVLLTRDVTEIVVASSRTPEERRGDLDAQRGANRLGVVRLAELSASLASIEPLAEVVDYGERRMRAALAALPDGQFRFEDVLDSAGPRPEQQSPTPVAVTLTVDGEPRRSISPGPGRSDPATSTVEAVTVARSRSPCARRPTRRSPPTAVRCGPSR
jgi:N-methylhydantoinase B/oxoprolinase/acetone carboxylase alpha subunit